MKIKQRTLIRLVYIIGLSILWLLLVLGDIADPGWDEPLYVLGLQSY